MSWGGVNFIAVLVAAFVAMAAGALWYGLLAKPWMRAHGFNQEMLRAGSGRAHGPIAYLVALVAKLVMAFCLARLLALVDAVSASNGVALGLYVWIGFVATVLSVNHRFAMKPWSLTLIDAGYWLVVLVAQGAIIGFFGPVA